jgi:hypothetical protein
MTDQVNVLEIMREIRAEIARRCGADEERILEYARLKLRAWSAAPPLRAWPAPQRSGSDWNVSEETLWRSTRGGLGNLLMLVRRLTRPLVKLFANLEALAHRQRGINAEQDQRLTHLEDLASNLAVEMVRLQLELQARDPRGAGREPRQRD